MEQQAKTEFVKYTKKDFESDQEVRWCPGCGDYAVLSSAQNVFSRLGIPKEKFVVVSGIGCSSRFPYYIDTYGFHSIHGRALPIATGVKLANPDLLVWVATGDGDGLSIGGNHFIHTLRRNVDIKILLFNNRIYGLTKGQYSPTSELGKINKSAPFGTIERPVDPISLALASGATFVARSVDIYPKHLQEIINKAASHKGSAFVEIYQNCNIYNDGAFDEFTTKEVRDDKNLALEHGKPMIFGKNRDKGIKLNGTSLELINLSDKVKQEELLIHDQNNPNPSIANMLAQMSPPDFPVPIGVFRSINLPTLEELVYQQIDGAKTKLGQGDLHTLLNSGDTWEIK